MSCPCLCPAAHPWAGHHGGQAAWAPEGELGPASCHWHIPARPRKGFSEGGPPPQGLMLGGRWAGGSRRHEGWGRLCCLSGAGISETHNLGVQVGVGSLGEDACFCMQVCVCPGVCTPVCPCFRACTCVYVSACACHSHVHTRVRTSRVCVFACQSLVPASSLEPPLWAPRPGRCWVSAMGTGFPEGQHAGLGSPRAQGPGATGRDGAQAGWVRGSPGPD